MITSYYEGKSLDYYRENILTEEQIKFATACVIQSLIYLRKKKIIHRDIMMKNIIMDNDGYFNLIDFSFSINYSDKNKKQNTMITYNMVTPPEMFNNSEYDYNSDYYRLGSVIYYIIFKKYPFIIKKEKNITDISINYRTITNYSYFCIDFLNKLLLSDYKKRIGFKNINELKNHSWFQGFDWSKLEKKEIKSPFKFIKSHINQSRCKKLISSEKNICGYKKYSTKSFYKSLIRNFDYSNNNIIEEIKEARRTKLIEK